MELTLKNFLVFIGSLFVCAVVFAALAAKLCALLSVSGKKLFGYGFFSALLTSLAAFVVSFAANDPFVVFWLLGVLFLVAGVVHTRYVHRRYPQGGKGTDFRFLLAAVVLGLSAVSFAIIIFSALQYFFKDPYFLFYPVLLSALLFFVPLFIWQSFLAAYAIPETAYPSWQYPLHNTPDYPEDVSREKMLVVGLELAKGPADAQKTYFRAKVPETMKLGDFIYHFINDYNDRHPDKTIAYMDADFEPGAWIFHAKRKWYQQRKILNPEFTIREAEVQENTVIICERTTLQATTNSFKNSYHAG